MASLDQEEHKEPALEVTTDSMKESLKSLALEKNDEGAADSKKNKLKVCFLLGHAYIDRRARTVQIVNDTMKDNVEILECFIPKGKKWTPLYEVCIKMGISCARQIPKDDYEKALVDAKPDVVVTLGWPFIVGDKVVGQHPYVINAHAAELPYYRGNYPFYNVLLENKESAANCIHHVDLGMDTGKLILVEHVELTPYDTYLSLADKAIGLENKNIPIVLKKIIDKEDISGVEQDHENAKLTNRGAHFKEEWHEIDPNMTVAEAMLLVRSHNPLVGSPYFYNNEGEKVFIKMWREDKKEGTDFPNSF